MILKALLHVIWVEQDIRAKHKAAAFYVPALTLLKPFVYGALIIVILCLHVMLPFVTMLKISANKSENNCIKQSLTERMDKVIAFFNNVLLLGKKTLRNHWGFFACLVGFFSFVVLFFCLLEVFFVFLGEFWVIFFRLIELLRL